MAYTYDDFVAAANNAGIMNQFSQRDLSVAKTNPEYGMSMLGLLQDISKAPTEEQRLLATEAANQMRKSYGINDTAPSAVGLPGQTTSYGSFNYEGQDSYQRLLDKIVNQGEFSYDHEKDPRWSAYKKTYLREGDRATEDTLAATAAATGGVPSSYAVTAATQAGDYYAGQLADKVPELYDSAYQRYLTEIGLDYDALGALEADRNFDYNEYLQRYEQALALYKTLGYATPEVAAILGIEARSDDTVPGGTKPGGTKPGDTVVGDGTAAAAALGGVLVGADKVNKSLYDEMLGQLSGPEGDRTVDTSDFKVTNRNGDGWVAVGNGRMTWTELEKAVDQGRVVEVIDPDKGTITYKYPSTNGGAG